MSNSQHNDMRNVTLILLPNTVIIIQEEKFSTTAKNNWRSRIMSSRSSLSHLLLETFTLPAIKHQRNLPLQVKVMNMYLAHHQQMLHPTSSHQIPSYQILSYQTPSHQLLYHLGHQTPNPVSTRYVVHASMVMCVSAWMLHMEQTRTTLS